MSGVPPQSPAFLVATATTASLSRAVLTSGLRAGARYVLRGTHLRGHAVRSAIAGWA